MKNHLYAHGALRSSLHPFVFLASILLLVLTACERSVVQESANQVAGSADETRSRTVLSTTRWKVLHYNIGGNTCWEATDLPGQPSYGTDSRGSITSRVSRILAAVDNYIPHAITFNEICYSQYRNIRSELALRGYGATYVSTTVGGQCDNYDAAWGQGFGLAVFFKGTVPNVQQAYSLPSAAGEEVRKMLCTDVVLDGVPIKLCTVHITNRSSKSAQIQQVANLTSGWIQSGLPVILTGDFNVVPTDTSLNLIYAHSGGTGLFREADESHACTPPLTFCRAGESTFGQVRNYYDSSFATTKIDYIFFSQAHFKDMDGDAKSAFPDPISDHNLLQGSAIWK